MEELVFVTETHGNDFPSMLSAPRIDVGVLQQIVAHLTLIACEHHRLYSVCDIKILLHDQQ